MGLIPAEHQHGETIVTFTISDGVDWTRKQLRLTVNAVNDKPTFVVNPDLSPVTIEGVSGGQAVVGNLSVTEDPGGIEVEQRVGRWATRINAGQTVLIARARRSILRRRAMKVGRRMRPCSLT